MRAFLEQWLTGTSCFPAVLIRNKPHPLSNILRKATQTEWKGAGKALQTVTEILLLVSVFVSPHFTQNITQSHLQVLFLLGEVILLLQVLDAVWQSCSFDI